MASKMHVPLSTTQGTPPSLPSSTGFLPIRAPITVDDFQSDGYKTDNSDSNTSSSNSTNTDNGFVSGEEEFDTASERPFIGEPDEENRVESGFGDRYQVSRPFVADRDEGSLGFEEEEAEHYGATDEFSPDGELDSACLNVARPIAPLSMDDDEFNEVVSEVEDGRFSRVVKVPNRVVQEILDTSPGVKVLGVEEDKLDELCVQSNSSPAEDQIGLLMMRDNGVLGSKAVDLATGSVDDMDSVKMVEDSGCVVTVDGSGDTFQTAKYPVGLAVQAATSEIEGDKLGVVQKSNTDSFGSKAEANCYLETSGEKKGILSDELIEDLIFGVSGTTKLLEQNLDFSSPLGTDVSNDNPQTMDGQITLDSDEDIDSDEEGDVDKEPVGKQLFDPGALAALLKAATGAELDGGRMAIRSVDGSRLFSLERPAGSGLPFHTIRHAPQPGVVKYSLSEEDKKMLEKIQKLKVKFLMLVHRLGVSPDDSIVLHMLNRLDPDEEKRVSQEFSLETAKCMAMQLQAEGKDDIDFSLNILVIGKSGVGKSATINSIFGEKRVEVNAFAPATGRVQEIAGTINGVKIRIIDTPGLRSPMKEEATNRKILASIKKAIKKSRPDIVLYVDRLDTHARDPNDLPLLSLISRSLTSSIWNDAIITLTHAASPPPDGPSGSPQGFEVYVAQRSRLLQQAISQAVGDPYLMHLAMHNPVSLVENHSLCRKNEIGENILPNGQSWRTQLLLLCCSLKVLSEASSMPEDLSDHKKPFGIRVRSLPLPHLLSSLLQSRPHPKLAADQGGDELDSDIDLVDLSDSDGEDEYDQLPPFKPLRKSQIQVLSKEQRKAYLEEYDYRVKMLQRMQWRDEVKRFKELKNRGKDGSNYHHDIGDNADQEDIGPAAVSVPLPDFTLPHSFDGDNPSYRYRALEPASQFLVRPVLDPQGWDHDCGYDGVNIEGNLAIASRFPGAFTVQITKDKKDFNIHLDSSISAKLGEDGSTMGGFDIQAVGRQLAYILRSETKFKKFKMNKTSAGISITLLGENIATGLKIEDQIALGKCLALVGNAGAMRSGSDTAYGANFEVHLKSADFPIDQDQSTLGLSLMKWRGDLALMANLQSQFSVGRNSKMAVRIGMNNKRSGQIFIKTSSSELQAALIGIVPIAVSIIKCIYPGSTARSLNILDS